MKIARLVTALVLIICLFVPACAEKKTTRKVSVEGPKNKYEVKLEKTEKD